ncbi:MAG: TIGR03085 family metal-binding protein [Nocardioides sp.]
MTDSLARRERQALCDLALTLDAEAPTLCGEWDLSMLLAHLIVRERRLLSASGIMIPQLAGVTDRAMSKEATKGVPAMVKTLRKPPLTPYSLPVVERFTQTLEYFVHHEDIRRAQPGWEPRELPAEDVEELWTLVSRSGAYLGRGLPVPVRLARSDRPGTSAAFRKGTDPVVVTGPVGELVLWAFGRSALHEVTLDGPDDVVARLHGADRRV